MAISYNPLLAVLALLHSIVRADIILQDLPPPVLSKRGLDYDSLSLRNHETFLWGDAGAGILGNLTVHTSKEDEHILSFERFKSSVDSVTCSNTGIDIVFKEPSAFFHAKGQWSWVNEKANHRVIFIVGTGDCGWNDKRQPFQLTSMSFAEETHSVQLTATPEDWHTVSHSHMLNVKSVPPDSSELRSLTKRDFSYQTPLSMDWTWPAQTLTVNLFELASIGIECDECGTSGKLDLDVEIETVLGFPLLGKMSLTTSGISLKITPKFAVSVTNNPSLEKYPLEVNVPLTPIQIPGVGSIGPNLVQKLGIEITGLQAETSLSTGFVVKVKDGATASFDFLPIMVPPVILPINPWWSGWGGSIEPADVTLEGKISGAFKPNWQTGLELGLNVLNNKVGAGLFLISYIELEFSAVTSESGACPDDPAKHIHGFAVDSKAGLEGQITAGFEILKTSHELEFNIFDFFKPGPSYCFPFGEAATSNASSPSQRPQPTSPRPQPTCGPTVSDEKNCGRCGNECNPGQQCINSTCVTPPDPVPTAFAPQAPRNAGTSAKGGWTLNAFDWQYWANDISLPKADYLVVDGRTTVNTKCINVRQTSEGAVFPDPAVIPAKSNILWETGDSRDPTNPDSCCVALFEDSDCKQTAGRYTLNCAGFNTVVPIAIRSWQIYNCAGRYEGPPTA